MRHFFHKVPILILLLLVLGACKDPRDGALSPESRTELTNYALRNHDTSMKYIKLVEKVAELLDEASAQRNNGQAMELVRKFRSDNDLALRLISKEFEGWQRHVDHDELMDFVYTLNRQPSAQKLRQLAPAFRRRISSNDAFAKDYDELLAFLEMRQ